jgi:hypothetical protein
MAVFTAIGTAVATAALGAAAAGTVAFVAVTTLTAAALQMAAGVALSLIGQALAGTPQPARFSVQGQIQGGDDVPRSLNFGLNCTAGSKVYQNEWGDGGKYSTRVIALGDAPIRELVSVEVDGVPVTLGGVAHADFGYPVTEFFKNGQNHLWIKFYDGTQTAADPFLVSDVSSTERPYASNRVGIGIPYVIATSMAPIQEDGEEQPLFQGLPAYKFVTNGLKLYNPAADSTVGGSGSHRWADPSTWGGVGDHNPVVQIYNLLRGIRVNGQWLYGLQDLSAPRLPAAHWIAQINKAQAAIDGPDGSEPTYRAGGEIQVGAPLHLAIEALLTSCQGRLAETGGVYKIYVSASDAPVAAFEDGDILSSEPQSFVPFLGLADTVNGISATYPNPAEGWNSKSAPPLMRPDLEALDGNRRLMSSVSLDLVPYGGQVQRLMKSALLEALRARRHTIVLGPEYRVLEPGDVVSWTSERNGYIDKLFRIDGVAYRANLDVMIDITEVDPSDYDWDQETDYTPVVDGPLQQVGAPALPMAGWQVFPATIKDQDGEDRRPSIEVRFSAGVSDVSGVRVQVRIAGETDPMFDGEVPYGFPHKVILSGQFSPNVQHEVRGIFVRTSGSQSDWSSWISVTTPNVLLSNLDIDIGDISSTVAELTEWIGEGTRAAMQQLRQTGTLIAEQDLANFDDKRIITRELESRTDDIVAGYLEAIEVATGPGSAIAQSIETVNVALGGNTAEVNIRFAAEGGPAGYAARYGVQAAVDDGDFRSASFYLDVPTDPDDPTRFVVVADQFVVTDGVDSESPFVIEGGVVKMVATRAGRITSFDGVSMVLDFDNPEIYMEA